MTHEDLERLLPDLLPLHRNLIALTGSGGGLSAPSLSPKMVFGVVGFDLVRVGPRDLS
jgi:hypothetical protein